MTDPAVHPVVPDVGAAAAAARRLARQGWRRTDLVEVPGAPWELGPRRMFAVVTAGSDDPAALLAAARGVRLVVIAEDPDAHAALLDDVARLAPPAAGQRSGSDVDALLSRLAGGETVTAAAAALHVSRRTANRWLDQARAEYGVRSTREAVRSWSERAR